MLIKYKFATGEVTEVEVSEEIGAVIIDLDRQEYNIDHKETRRHCSLDAYNLDDSLLPSDVDVARDFERSDERKRLYAAIARLQPQQQELVRRVYFNREKIVDIAAEAGVSEAAIRNRLKKIMAALKKFLN